MVYQPKEIENWEHDHLAGAKRVTLAGSDVQVLIDKTTTASMTYIGYGRYGLAEDADGWLIKRIDKTTSPTRIKTADTNLWSARADVGTTYA